MSKRTKVEDELEKYNVKIDISKRTGKAKELEPHTINLGHYSPSAKTCGFTSDKLVDWVCAFEKYYDESEDLKCEWIKVANQQNIYSEIQIQIQKLGGVKCVTIHIFLTIGIILVKGNYWKQWAQFEFELFRKMVCGEDQEVSTIQGNKLYPPNQDFLTDGKTGGKEQQQLGSTTSALNDGKIEGKEQQPVNTTVVVEEQEIAREESPNTGGKEIDSLYAENSKLKESVMILEKSLTNITKAFDVIRDSLSNQEVKIRNQLSQLDQKFDDKLLVYNQELQTEFKREITNMKQSMRDKVVAIEEKFKNKLTEMENATQNELSNSSMVEENTKLKDQITNIESRRAKDTDRIKDLESEVEQQSIRMEHLATETKDQRNVIKNLQLQIAEVYNTCEQQQPGDTTPNSITRKDFKTKPSTFSGATYANITMQNPTSQSGLVIGE